MAVAEATGAAHSPFVQPASVRPRHPVPPAPGSCFVGMPLPDSAGRAGASVLARRTH